ncbi:hypothetical protein [Actinoplanes rectilineatus]|uniref:hypothetical protein n=1 Tax=Actinoplanes rectilineatus TaxID=113571 RepID=UPI0006977E9E|nr:hypothetical protein [Actinoplanes rectilineatus]
MARTATALNRLLDVVTLLAGDTRLQIYLTHDAENPAMLGDGFPALVGGLGILTLTWDEARTRHFGLVLSASENDRLHQLSPPILLLSHGLGFQKFYPGTRVIAGLDPERSPATTTIGLSHPDQQRHLNADQERRAAVVGDPALGRMAASTHRRDHYRAALGADGRRLVVIASTWGPDSLYGSLPLLPERLCGQLPMDEYTVAVVLHPGIRARHSDWQVRAWLGRATRSGVRVVPPAGEWQAAVIAADCVLSDHGSMSAYAAAWGVPLILGPAVSDTTVPGSVVSDLADRCPRLDPDSDLRKQIDTAMAADDFRTLTRNRINHQIAPDDPAAAAPLRRRMYRMLGLDEPGEPAEFPPLPVPAELPATVGAWVAGIDEEGRLTRFPDSGTVHDDLPMRHVVADVEHATLTQVAGATVVCSTASGDLLAQWPHAVIAASPLEGGCRVRTRSGDDVVIRTEPGVDRWAAASWAYRRLRRGEPLTGPGLLRLGDREITVRAEAH